MIDRKQYNKILIASLLIVGSVFLSVVWKYLRHTGIMYSWPFLDISLGHNELSFISSNPEKKKVIDLWQLFPFLVAEFYVFIYFYLFRWIGPMHISVNRICFKLGWHTYKLKNFHFNIPNKIGISLIDKKFDLWHLQMGILAIMFLDFMLTHRQTPIRETLVTISAAIQFYYCYLVYWRC